jgi:hypothetical protein
MWKSRSRTGGTATGDTGGDRPDGTAGAGANPAPGIRTDILGRRLRVQSETERLSVGETRQGAPLWRAGLDLEERFGTANRGLLIKMVRDEAAAV